MLAIHPSLSRSRSGNTAYRGACGSPGNHGQGSGSEVSSCGIPDSCAILPDSPSRHLHRVGREHRCSMHRHCVEPGSPPVGPFNRGSKPPPCGPRRLRAGGSRPTATPRNATGSEPGANEPLHAVHQHPRASASGLHRHCSGKMHNPCYRRVTLSRIIYRRPTSKVDLFPPNTPAYFHSCILRYLPTHRRDTRKARLLS